MAQHTLTGLVVRGRRLEWTALHRSGSGYEVARREQAELDTGEARDLAALARDDRPAALKALAAACAHLSGEIVLGLPSDSVLLRLVTLPAANAAELAGMVELQADKFNPFPAESAVVSHEVLQERDGQTSVLIAIVEEPRVQALGSLLSDAGVRPRAVDVDVLGWWRLLADSGHIQKDACQVVLRQNGDTCDLVIAENGLPLALRAFTELQGLPPEEAAAEIQREVVFTLASVGVDPDANRPLHAALWHSGPAPQALIEALRDVIGSDVQSFDLGTLPPASEGIARRRADGRALNLAPASWGEAEQRKRFRCRMVGLTAAVLGVWVAGATALFGGLEWEKQRLASRQARLTALEPAVKETRATRERLIALQQYMNRTYSALECLREVSDLLPPGIELKSFLYRKGKNVEMQGGAPSITLVYDFKKELDESDLFAVIELGRTVRDAQGREGFKITANLPQAGVAE